MTAKKSWWQRKKVPDSEKRSWQRKKVCEGFYLAIKRFFSLSGTYSRCHQLFFADEHFFSLSYDWQRNTYSPNFPHIMKKWSSIYAVLKIFKKVWISIFDRIIQNIDSEKKKLEPTTFKCIQIFYICKPDSTFKITTRKMIAVAVTQINRIQWK